MDGAAFCLLASSGLSQPVVDSSSLQQALLEQSSTASRIIVGSATLCLPCSLQVLQGSCVALGWIHCCKFCGSRVNGYTVGHAVVWSHSCAVAELFMVSACAAFSRKESSVLAPSGAAPIGLVQG